MKTYRYHNCGKRHYAYKDFARCAFYGRVYVYGEGPFAFVSWCNKHFKEVDIILSPDEESAQSRLNGYCGASRCTHTHELIKLELS